MSAREMRQPGADHPITISPTRGRVAVTVGGIRIADSVRALTLQEADYPPVQYIPRADVNMALLQRTTHQTYCPYKGECIYYSITPGGERATNAVWSYESPYPAVMDIKECLAFYPDRVDAITVTSSAEG